MEILAAMTMSLKQCDNVSQLSDLNFRYISTGLVRRTEDCKIEVLLIFDVKRPSRGRIVMCLKSPSSNSPNGSLLFLMPLKYISPSFNFSSSVCYGKNFFWSVGSIKTICLLTTFLLFIPVL